MKIFSQLKYDLPASIIVFFIALPLCLGIALASGAPLFSGIIAGIIGGIVVGSFSGSALGVSGPAAGLATIVISYLAILGGSWESFLLVVILAGVIQVIMGYLKMGTIAYYFPSSVIKGMLCGIGLLIIIKQIPYAFGYQNNLIKDVGSNIISDKQIYLPNLDLILQSINYGALLIGFLSIGLMIVWELFLTKKYNVCQFIPAPLVVVVLGIISSYLFLEGILPFTLSDSQLVKVPTSNNFIGFFDHFWFPDFSQITNPQIYQMAFVVAIVASLETILSVEACDKIDPQKRITPTNRELKAQGIGNIVSGLIGGLPITQVIVRSSANVTFGAKTKLSAILHGLILLIAVISISDLLNMIPLSSLAAILIIIGYKLAKPIIFKQMYQLGWEQFVPFIITIVGILAFDLLTGIGFGMAAAIVYLVVHNFYNPYHRATYEEKSPNEHFFRLAEEVSFLNKGKILEMLRNIPDGANVTIDGRNSKTIHHDVIEILQDFQISAKSKNISLKLIEINFKNFK